jgi:hypothetical protein
MFSVIWDLLRNISFKSNGLVMCLKNRHIHEASAKQEKIASVRDLPTELSTSFVDAFSLVVTALPLQRLLES